MKIISVNVGLPREIFHDGRMIRTSIFKSPVAGRVRVRALNIDGDRQADLTVHGGPSKAIYVYPSEHYHFWRRELGDEELTPGAFGENLTTEGLLEKELNIGDRLCVGSVELAVTEPRLPCYKLGVRFNRDDMVKRFLRSRRTGFYCAVMREGELERGRYHYASRPRPRGRDRGRHYPALCLRQTGSQQHAARRRSQGFAGELA